MDIEFWQKFKLPIALSVVGIVLIIGGVFASGLQKAKSRDFPKESLIQGQKVISVDVSGAVKNAGVYKLAEGARIEDVVKAAGGFSEKANQEYISKYLNMAQKLSDGGKVYVLSEEEVSLEGSSQTAGVSTNSQININTSSQTQLESLPGIGPVTASKIVSGRPYQSTDELISKKVVGQAVFEKIKDQIVVY